MVSLRALRPWVKEFANVFARVEKAIADIEACTFPGKLNGAVGNYNAHLSAYPDAPWPAIAKNLIEDMGLEYNPYTIQIEPHDGMAPILRRHETTERRVD